MKIFVVGNVHLYRDESGEYYSPSVYSYEFLSRYLKVFEELRIIGKVRLINEGELCQYLKVSGPGIEIVELPFYQGWIQMFKVLPRLIKIYVESIRNIDCCIFRIAQIESFFVYLFSRFKKVQYCVEVVNDPACFSPFFVRWISCWFVKFMCRNAAGASYVTKKFLQSKYPNRAMLEGDKGKYFQSYYSSIDLEDSAISTEPIVYDIGETLHIVHVANVINSNVKGHIEVIEIVANLLKLKKNVDVTFIGDGTKRKDYEEYAKSLGLKKFVFFEGKIANKNILLDKLRKSNLMVLPTRMEGLPRTIIEAMSVGLPCLSTPVAGIPELLDEKYLLKPTDVDGFVSMVCRLIDDPNELLDMSKNNLKKALDYRKSILDERRIQFYKKLKYSQSGIGKFI